MNRREKLLAASVGLMVVLWGSTMGVSKYRLACEKNEKTLQKVLVDLKTAHKDEERGLLARNRLSELGRQSLPTDTDIAAVLYEDWLRVLLGDSGLEVADLTSKTSPGPHKRTQEIVFTVNATGSLAKLSNFLHGFYEAGHLHRISETTLTPEEESDLLKITLTIDALSLDNCKREDELSDRPNKIKQEPLKKSKADIVSRNLFAVYKPPVSEEQPVETQPSIAEDTVAAQAFVTGMTYGKNGWQMSVRMQDSGKIQFFREGDAIAIGSFTGNITKLDGRYAVVTVGNQQMRVRLGQNLSQAQPVADLAG